MKQVRNREDFLSQFRTALARHPDWQLVETDGRLRVRFNDSRPLDYLCPIEAVLADTVFKTPRIACAYSSGGFYFQSGYTIQNIIYAADSTVAALEKWRRDRLREGELPTFMSIDEAIAVRQELEALLPAATDNNG